MRGLVEDVRCYVETGEAGYLLTVERAGEHLLEELYDDFDALFARAQELRSTLVRVGFVPVAAEAGSGMRIDSLLLDFVRLGTAPLASVGVRPS